MANENKAMGMGPCLLVQVKLRALMIGVVGIILGAAAIITASAFYGGTEGVEVPVIMYHSLLKDEARHGKYVVSPAEFENDLQYLSAHGYTTILTEDLVAYTKGDELPQKPVIITFDDGYYSNYLYAFPLAQKYQMKFIISPIGRYVDAYSETGETNAYYSHATWDHLKEMQQSGLVEVQNHSYDLHEKRAGALGAAKRPGESDAGYRERLRTDLIKAQKAFSDNLGLEPSAFVYPFGAMSSKTEEIVRELGFSATFTCREKISRITRDTESLYEIGRFLRPSGISSSEFFKKIGLD